jgi:hypothetical protein
MGGRVANNMPTGTPDFTALALAATALHELFAALMGAGFTERQAITYLAELMRPTPGAR